MSGKLKPFQEHGHYTSVHDAVFDVVMPYCPPNAFKVLLFVLRKTRGWKKEEDVLRYAEIKAGTGIKSDATLAKELAWLLKKKLLNARDESGGKHVKGSRKAPAYSLNRDFELRISGASATSETEVRDTATTTENKAATTSETEASNNQVSQEPSVEALASSGKPQTESVVAMEKHVVDGIYRVMDQAGFSLDNTDFPYQLGRAQNMLRKLKPTDEELEALPEGCVSHYEIYGKTDATAALRYLRQQKARSERMSETKPAAWEPVNPHGEVGARAKDKPRAAFWYVSAYGCDFETAERLVGAGKSHVDICKELEAQVA